MNGTPALCAAPGRRHKRRGLGRLVALVLALALVVATPFLFWNDRVEALLTAGGALDWMRGTGWGWAAGAGLIVEDVVLPIPSTAVMAALGILYGPVLGGLIGGVASMLAACLGYWACRLLGPAVAERLAGRAGVAEARRLFDRWGFAIVALSRWFPVLPETVAFLAGPVRAPFPRFFGRSLPDRCRSASSLPPPATSARRRRSPC